MHQPIDVDGLTQHFQGFVSRARESKHRKVTYEIHQIRAQNPARNQAEQFEVLVEETPSDRYVLGGPADLGDRAA